MNNKIVMLAAVILFTSPGELLAARQCFNRTENRLLWDEVMMARKATTFDGVGNSSNQDSDDSKSNRIDISSSTGGAITTPNGDYPCYIGELDDGTSMLELTVDGITYQWSVGEAISSTTSDDGVTTYLYSPETPVGTSGHVNFQVNSDGTSVKYLQVALFTPTGKEYFIATNSYVSAGTAGGLGSTDDYDAKLTQIGLEAIAE